MANESHAALPGHDNQHAPQLKPIAPKHAATGAVIVLLIANLQRVKDLIVSLLIRLIKI